MTSHFPVARTSGSGLGGATIEAEILDSLSRDLGRALLGQATRILSGASRWYVRPPEAAPLEALIAPWREDGAKVLEQVVVSYEASFVSARGRPGPHFRSGKGLLALIPLLVEKDDPEVQWHAKHGLVLTVAEFAVFIGLALVGMVIGAFSAGLGCILGLAWPLVMVAILVLHVMCIVKGLNGQRLLVPGISEFADKF